MAEATERRSPAALAPQPPSTMRCLTSHSATATVDGDGGWGPGERDRGRDGAGAIVIVRPNYCYRGC